MNRFQRFLVFWKAKNLLFHLETTPLHNVYFLVEQNSILCKKVNIFLKFAKLDIWDLG